MAEETNLCNKQNWIVAIESSDSEKNKTNSKGLKIYPAFKKTR